MYELTLMLHSWLRWAALLTGIAATAMLLFSGRDLQAARTADRWGLIFTITLDLQLLLGLLLYVALSPITSAIFDNFGAAMRDPAARFWAVEHVSLMLFAVIIAHVGRVLARKAAAPGAKKTRLLVCFTLAVIAMLAATPWPGMPAGRPLFRVDAGSSGEAVTVQLSAFSDQPSAFSGQLSRDNRRLTAEGF
jgi:hypothetical protein